MYYTRALTKYVRISPKKMRDLAREIQGLRATEALERLCLNPRKGASLIAKTLKSAIANAENNDNVSSVDLIVISARIDEGPSFRRFRPVSRGSAHPFRKATSHILIELSNKITFS